MIRRWIVACGIASLGLPLLARAQQTYQYEDNQGEMTSDEPADPNQGGSYSEYNAADADVSGEVSVDLAAPGASVNFETFQGSLAPYGEWVDVPPYGRVWRPTQVQAGWKPYYNGHWEWTEEGWLWVSDEPWGWAAYHYGRWTVTPGLGWVWVPGYQWAPAWVSWRFSGAVVGWAPLLPGFSVYVNTFPDYYVSYFTFVPCQRFVGVPVHSVAYAPTYAPRWFHETRPAPPRAVYSAGVASPAWGGPAHGFVEQRVGHRIAPARIMPVASPGQIASVRREGVVPVFRPEARPAMRPAPGVRPQGSFGYGGARPTPGRGPGAAPAPGYRGPPTYVPGRGPGPAPAPGYRGGTGYAPGQAAPRPQGGYGPPGGYAPGRPSGGYAPGPSRPAGGYTPAPSRSQGGYVVPPRQQQGGGFAPGRASGGGFAPRPSGGGGFAPHGGGAAPHGGGGREHRR